jgi:type II secretory pathway pseudopilin PulG
MRTRAQGFTVIEIIFVALLLGAASVIFFVQKHDIQVQSRDNQRKTAINAMYYDLQKVFYPANGYYPSTISAKNLTAIDPSLFKDPNGITLGTAGSDYTYSPTDCTDNHCSAFSLQATLENQADYIKTNTDS